MSEQTNDDKAKKDSLALIIGGIFILGLVFVTYKYFNQGSALISNNEEDNQQLKFVDTSSTSTERSDKNISDTTLVSNNAETLPKWTANHYKKGDITGNTYTVKRGDTLWEIATAVYGNGADWVKILNANSANIGYLPNGQQSLIVPGQVLVLP